MISDTMGIIDIHWPWRHPLLILEFRHIQRNGINACRAQESAARAARFAAILRRIAWSIVLFGHMTDGCSGDMTDTSSLHGFGSNGAIHTVARGVDHRAAA
jgi:hypothetical protein